MSSSNDSSPSPDSSPSSNSPSSNSTSQSPPPASSPPPPASSPPPQSPPPSPPPPSNSPPPPSPDKDNGDDNNSGKDKGNGSNSGNNNDKDKDNNNDNSSSNSGSNSNSPPSPPKNNRPPKSDALPLAPPKQSDKSPASHTPSPSKDKDSSNSPSTKQNSGGNEVAELVAAVLGGVIIIMLVIACVFCLTRKKKRRSGSMQYYADSGPKGNEYYNAPPKGGRLPSPQGSIPPPPGAWHPSQAPTMTSDVSSAYSGPHGPVLPPPSPSLALGFNKSTFSYDELALATGGFSPANLLGQGGFGYVYKGFLPNGKEIAVKQLKSGSGQGEREFQAEVDIISRVHHRHLVSLVGYCITGAHRMLVYEFVCNNTLEHHLHGKGLPVMDWPSRLKIAMGSAKGLAYLHEDCHPRIIHRDIKAANILLDFNFEAMVADFGLAKLSQDNHTHVSTRIMGTFGYLAPEYASSGKLTEKSDVFSYGVMLLELITGRRPVDSAQMEDSLVDWARPMLSRALADGNYEDIVDPRLEHNYNPVEMSRMAACAAASVRHSGRRRPKMSQIVRALEGDVSLEDLNEGVKPGQSMMFSSSSDYDSSTSSYTSNMRQFRKVALASAEFSDEYGRQTSEYGVNPSESSSSGETHGAGAQRPKPPRAL